MIDDDYYEKRIGKPERLIDAHPLKTRRDNTTTDKPGLREYLASRPADTLKLTQEELEAMALNMLPGFDPTDKEHVRTLVSLICRLAEASVKLPDTCPYTYKQPCLYKWSRDDD